MSNAAVMARPTTRWCARCRINPASLVGSNVCGTCADDLRDEADADHYDRVHEAQLAGRL